MMTEQNRAPSMRDESELERILRDFYARELPTDLREGTGDAASPSCRVVPAAIQAPPSRPFSRTLGLTAMVAALMLAVSALLWMPSRGSGPHAGTDQHAASPRGSDQATGPPDGRPHPAGSATKRQPIEMQSRSQSGVPVGAEAAHGAGAENEFPELDIRIIPIDEDR